MFDKLSEPEFFVTSEVVCEYLSVSVRTLYRWLGAYRAFPCYKVGGVWRFKLSEVRDWVEQNNPR